MKTSAHYARTAAKLKKYKEGVAQHVKDHPQVYVENRSFGDGAKGFLSALSCLPLLIF